MEEENKVVAEEEQPKQEIAEPNQQNEGMDEDSKYSLITFILACAGLVVCAVDVGRTAFPFCFIYLISILIYDRNFA